MSAIRPCRKRRYRDHKEAVHALHACQNQHRIGNHRRQETRSYECYRCRGFHLTSQPTPPAATAKGYPMPKPMRIPASDSKGW